MAGPVTAYNINENAAQTLVRFSQLLYPLHPGFIQGQLIKIFHVGHSKIMQPVELITIFKSKAFAVPSPLNAHRNVL
jgi:hypothetical protein